MSRQSCGTKHFTNISQIHYLEFPFGKLFSGRSLSQTWASPTVPRCSHLVIRAISLFRPLTGQGLLLHKKINLKLYFKDDYFPATAYANFIFSQFRVLFCFSESPTVFPTNKRNHFVMMATIPLFFVVALVLLYLRKDVNAIDVEKCSIRDTNSEKQNDPQFEET